MNIEIDGGAATKKRLFYGNDESQYGELRLPKGTGPYPVAIVIHGGFWKSMFAIDLMDRVSDDLTNRGIATWNLEYRRVGNPGGGYPGTLQDVAVAADYLRVIADTYNLDLTRAVTVGHSAGAQLALWLAGRAGLPDGSVLRTQEEPMGIKGAVSLGGIIDLELMWKLIAYKQRIVTKVAIENPVADYAGGTPLEYQERYQEISPAQMLPLQVPQVLVHGELDVNVPVKLSVLYKELAQQAGDEVKLITFPSAEHFEIIDPNSAVWPVIAEEILQLIYA